MSVDQWLDRRYHAERYHCAHFAAEVWLALVGEDISARLGPLLRPMAERSVPRDLVRRFVTLRAPEDPCLALFQRPRVGPHLGVLVRGRVLHLTEAGAEHTDLATASRGFPRVSFHR